MSRSTASPALVLMPPVANPVRFGSFEVDFRAGELRKNGRKLKVQEQPLQVLAILLEHPGEVVTREELQRALWSNHSFVDFDHSLNAAVKRLREALGDSAESPHFIETLPRHGYRFIAAIEHQQPPGKRVMVAVLPFENLSDGPKQEYFSRGVTEEIINQLARLGVPSLGVIAATSVMQYKNSGKTIGQIGRELGTDYILEGSVRQERNRVRVTAQLIAVQNQAHIWADRYEGNLRDILLTQADVARAVVQQTRLKLTPQAQARLANLGPRDPEAYNAYLRGRYSYHWNSQEAVVEAIGYYEQAVKLDPGYGLAWASLAEARSFRAAHYGSTEDFLSARKAAERALALDANLAEAHAVMGWIQREYDWDWAAAAASLQRGLDLAPGNAMCVREAARLAAALGRFDQALAIDRRALELDPLNGWAYMTLVLHLYYHDRSGEAVETAKRALELGLNVPALHCLLGRVYLAQSRPQEALAEAGRETTAAFRLQGLALAYHALGRKQESDRAVAKLIATYPRESAFQIAEVYAFRGDKDEALEWLERAYAHRDSGLTIMKGDPLLKNLEPDARFQNLLLRMDFQDKKPTSPS